jgi:hypothetical protein
MTRLADQSERDLIRKALEKTLPAGLLPLLVKGLSTLRLARSDLSLRPESASGRSGTYRDRFFTWQQQASFRTHHNGEL